MARIFPAVLVLAIAISAGPAMAKGPPGAVAICGADRCRELHGAALKQTSTLTSHRGSALKRAAPFYDIVSVREDAMGGRYIEGALRYVPSARAVRSVTGTGGPTWFRTDWMLTRYLRSATDGVVPRPARALDDGPAAVGTATLKVKQELLASGSPSSDATQSYRSLIGSALLALAIVCATLTWRRRRRRRIVASAPYRASGSPRGSH